jgi:hypothetical protein
LYIFCQFDIAKHGCLPPQVREIYEMAVEAEPPYSLSDGDCKTMCVRYAQLETRVRPDQAAACVSVAECSEPECFGRQRYSTQLCNRCTAGCVGCKACAHTDDGLPSYYDVLSAVSGRL